MQDGDRDGLGVRAGDVRHGPPTRDVLRNAHAGWASAGWLLAALLSFASFPVSLFTTQSPVMTGSSGRVESVSQVVTTFYPWGGTSTVTTGPAAVQVGAPDGPNYVVPMLPSALVLAAAAVIGFLPNMRRSARPAERIVTAAAPVAAGVLVAVSACQWLFFRAFSSPYEPGGVYAGVPNGPEWFLGLSPWLGAAGALTALLTCVFVELRPAETSAGPTPQTPAAADHDEAKPGSSLSTDTAPATTAPTRPFTRPDPRPPHTEDDVHSRQLDLTLYQRPSTSGGSRGS